MDLQLRHTELSNKLLSMKVKIFNIQKQMRKPRIDDLQTEQSKVSALKKFKHKLADENDQYICVASPWNIKGDDQDSTKIIWISTVNTQVKYLRKVQNLRNVVWKHLMS